MSKLINRIRNLRNLEYILLSVILLLGFIVRLYKIGNPIADWHSWRQADTASVSRTYVEEGIDFLYPRYQDISSIQTGAYNPQGYRFVEFPIYNVIHALLAKNFTLFSLEVWGRLLSITSSLVSTFLLFLIGKRFMGKWGGVLAAFFFAFIPYNIYFTRVILPEPMATTFALSALWFFVKFFDTDKDLYFYLSGLSFCLALLVKPFTLFYAPAIIYLIYLKHGSLEKISKDPKLLIKYLIFSNIILVPFFAWRAWMGRYPQGIPFFKWAFNGDQIRFRPAFWRWIFGERLARLLLGTWGLVPFTYGILKAKKETYFNLYFLLGMFLYVLTFATANVRHDYYQTFIVPAVALTLAAGSLALWEAKNLNRTLSRGILVFSVVLMLGMGAYQVKENYKVNHPEIIEAGKAVDELTPKDALVIAPYNGDTAFIYQTKRWGWPAIDDSIDKIIEKGADYYVTVNLNDLDTKMIVSRFEVVRQTDKYLIADLHKPKK
ncbi:MAG: glycosyltransferase family 39 protein [Patescibacteria group bacterium]